MRKPRPEEFWTDNMDCFAVKIGLILIVIKNFETMRRITNEKATYLEAGLRTRPGSNFSQRSRSRSTIDKTIFDPEEKEVA